ncbi:hypothetical protein KP509_08G050300 [Ceratopteris richardii]|nr:hypothetical protein KP509_08G050300 [Ceratopteris richardii]
MSCYSRKSNEGSILRLQAFSLLCITVMISPQAFVLHAGGQGLSDQDFDALLKDLQAQKFFTAASILGFLTPPFLTDHITLLVPTDTAIAAAINQFSAISLAYPAIIQFHILGRNLNFDQLKLFPVGTWLPTMVPGKGVQVTSSSPSDFRLNNAKISQPDICPSMAKFSISCQGINSLLNLSSILTDVPKNPPVLAPLPSVSIPPVPAPTAAVPTPAP